MRDMPEGDGVMKSVTEEGLFSPMLSPPIVLSVAVFTPSVSAGREGGLNRCKGCVAYGDKCTFLFTE